MSSEEYAAVDCWIVRRTDQAVRIRIGAWPSGRTAWIPRNLLYGPDEKMMALLSPGTRMTLRMFAWKAKEEGLLSETDATPGAQSNMFGGEP